MTQATPFDEQSEAIQSVQEQTSTVVETARTLTVAADDDVEQASVVLKRIAETKRGAEERRQFFVKPLNDQVKKINDLFKELVAPLLEADTTIRRKVSEYRTAQAEIARKEQARLNKLVAQQQARLDRKAEIKGVEAPKITAPVVAAAPTKVGNVVARRVWKFQVIDSAIVPRQFLTIDEQAIRAAVREGVREIAGVRIYQEEELAVR